MSSSLRYSPALDGLRAFTVIGIMLYHGGTTWLGGGFLSVDVFFRCRDTSSRRCF